MNEIHIPVLLSDVINMLSPKQGDTYLDLTAGYGGHADKILEVTRNYKGAVLNDRDQNAIDFLEAKYQEVKPKLIHDDFYSTALRLVAREKKLDLILADFGVSSPQLDKAERGFSFAKEARLDMRMNGEQDLDAWTIVNKWSEGKLADIFERYAEERPGRAKLLAREICMHRPINTTTELAELIRSKSPYSHTHPATKIFQAIRIAINDEINSLKEGISSVFSLLKPGARLLIISFHSLEDRIVKEFYKEKSSSCICPKDLPVCVCKKTKEARIITKKPIVPSEKEIEKNKRAASAKLRILEKI